MMNQSFNFNKKVLYKMISVENGQTQMVGRCIYMEQTDIGAEEVEDVRQHYDVLNASEEMLLSEENSIVTSNNGPGPDSFQVAVEGEYYNQISNVLILRAKAYSTHCSNAT